MVSTKKQAWQFYDEWRKVGSYCPVLKSHVRVTLLGWNHLVGNENYSRRSPNDRFRRFKLLPFAKIVIEDTKSIRNRSFNKFYALESKIEINKKRTRIKVVVIEDKTGNKIFLSVMDRKHKKSTNLPHATMRHEE